MFKVGFAQQVGFQMRDSTFYLEDFTGGWGVGNGCGVDNYMVTNCYSNMNMNFETLQVLNASITVHGIIENEGEIYFLCDTSELIILGETLETEEVDLAPEFKLFPNPAVNTVNVNGENIARIQFVNMSGQVIKDFKTTINRNKIQISNLASGVYFINVYGTSGELVTKRLIKK